MCVTCGCGDEQPVRISRPDMQTPHHQNDQNHQNHQNHQNIHGHNHPHDHHHGTGSLHTHGREHDGDIGRHHGRPTRVISLEQNVLARNDELAKANRRSFAERGVLAVNIMGSPGAGKTTLLVRTLQEMRGRTPVAVVEGDQETEIDAARVRATGCPVVQINTGNGCHLDAGMVADAVSLLEPEPGALLFVENVGNLVCPALFDVGEHHRVVVISTAEGADKPIKYPHMFRTADLVIINKSDLLPYLDFDPDHCAEQVGRLNPDARVLTVSATTGDGLAPWTAWLEAAVTAAATAATVASSG